MMRNTNIKETARGSIESRIKEIVFRFLDPKEYRILLFGSRLQGGARPFSDYDIGIVGRRSVPLEKLSMIKEALEESDLPYTVDVVDFSIVGGEFREAALSRAKRI
jgi:predicted nucleotidyltransferase